MSLAQQICANAPVSVQACLAAVNDIVAADDELGWQQTERALTAATALGRRPRRCRRLLGEATTGLDRTLTGILRLRASRPSVSAAFPRAPLKS